MALLIHDGIRGIEQRLERLMKPARAMSNWQDISSRSRDGNPRAEPTALKQPCGPLRVTLHRHISNPDEWHVSCPQLHIDKFELGNIPLAAAKKAAVDRVRAMAEHYLAAAEALHDD